MLETYRTLPAFKDVKEGLACLRASNFCIHAFSNGSVDAVETLLIMAGIRDYFLGVISVDNLKSFKPNPGVYSYFLRRAGVSGSSAWLISSNPFDVIGAISAGMSAAWVRRSTEDIFDPWGIEPTLIVNSFCDLNEQITEY